WPSSIAARRRTSPSRCTRIRRCRKPRRKLRWLLSDARFTSDVSGYFALDPRPILPEDTQGTRILLMGALGVTPYIDRALEVLDLAERGNDPEHRALVIARDGTVAGLVLFGSIAGTRGGARLHTALLAAGVDADDVGERLMRAMAATAKGGGARFLLAEM